LECFQQDPFAKSNLIIKYTFVFFTPLIIFKRTNFQQETRSVLNLFTSLR
jgi:hypothetical protein